MPDDPGGIQSLFRQLVDLPEGARDEFLAKACVADSDLRRRLEAMLAEHAESHQQPEPSNGLIDATLDSGPIVAATSAHSFGTDAESSIPSDTADTVGLRWDGHAGATIGGRYTLLEKIGEGGMGEVWVAKQSQPVKRRVALKLIKAGMDSKSVLSRFELERQALALMDHPNIARVLDGGLTPNGQPFFAMELVNGVSLDAFCDQAKLSLRERLELFVPICLAIQHAHQKGIVHRDLKPGNILVAMVDGKPAPKVIDFGVAKATSGNMVEETMTQLGSVVGTLEYMSPEQAGLSGEDVDTRSDIYSLGVVLYELLTGLRPIDRTRLQKAAITEMIRIIREEEPSKPSTRLSTVESLPTLAAARQTAPSKLMALLRGELDWVVMKCLEKDRERRYETANSLVRDIQRYLSDEPVEARPPSSGYKIQKFLKRNKGPAIAASLVLFTLVAGIAGTTWGLFEARRQEGIATREASAKEVARQAAADRAEGERLAKLDAQEKRAEAESEKRIAQAVRDFLQKKLLGQADVTTQANTLLQSGSAASEAKQNPTILELLDRASSELSEERIEANFPNQLKVQAEILQTVGVTYRGIGEFEKAIPLLQRALKLRKELETPDQADTSTTMSHLALVYKDAGKLDEAVLLFEEALKLQSVAIGADAPATLNTMKNLAGAYQLAGKLKKSQPLYEKTLDLQSARLGVDHPETLLTRSSLASAYLQSGQWHEAVPLFESTLPQLIEQLGAEHPQTLDTMNALAQAYLQTRQFDKAVAILEENLKLKTDKLGEEHPQTLISMGDLAYAYLNSGNLAKALPMSKKSLQLKRAQLGDEHPETLTSMNNLAIAYKNSRQLDKAIPLFEETVKHLKDALGQQHPRTLGAMSSLASAYQDDGQLDKAKSLYAESLRLLRAELGLQHPYTLIGINNLAQAYHQSDQPELAAPLLAESLTLIKEPKLRHSKQAMLAVNLLKLKRFADAEPVARACLAIREKLFPDHWILFNSKVILGRTLVGQKKYAEAEPIVVAGYEGMKQREKQIPEAAKANLKTALETLVGLYEATGDSDKVSYWKAFLTAHPDAAKEPK